MVAQWKGFPQPLIRRLPDVKGHWPAEAWDKRAVLGCHDWHILFTTHTSGDLKTNPHVGHCVSGDVFLLWISDTKTQGLKFYVDVKPEVFDQDWLGSFFPHMFSQLKPVKSDVSAPQKLSGSQGMDVLHGIIHVIVNTPSRASWRWKVVSNNTVLILNSKLRG